MFRALLVIVLFATFPALANQLVFGHRGESLPVTHLATFQADPGESERDFVLRVGSFLDRYTRNNGFEACASLVINDGKLTARVSTSNSQVGCLITIMEGDEPVGRGIHSHPEAGILRLSANDNVFLRGNGGNRNGRVSTVRRTAGPSKTDRAGGPGYLVENGMVVFYTPHGQDEVVGPVAASPLSPSQLARASL